MMCFALFLCLAFSALGCAQRRIIGGEPVLITEYPHHVAIEDKFALRCSGSLIAENWVLTTGACCLDIWDVKIDVRVRSGSDTRQAGGEISRISRIIIHPEFNQKTLDYDVCLLDLDKDLNFNENTQPIHFPYLTDGVSEHTPMYVSGFGRVRADSDSNHYTHLVAATVFKGWSNARCQELIGRNVTDRMFCAGDGSGAVGPCIRDDGGALIKGEEVRFSTQIGIVSRPSCGYVPSVFTNLLDREINFFVRKYALPHLPSTPFPVVG